MQNSGKHISVIHIESGLGNQMLSYCELLALRKENPRVNYYIETLVYDIPECNDTICQWNGYELDKAFGIREENVKDLFNESQWDIIKSAVIQSRFWQKNWNYAPYTVKALNTCGLNLKNTLPNRENVRRNGLLQAGCIGRIRQWFNDQTWLGVTLKRFLKNYIFNIEKQYLPYQEILFEKTDCDIFAGQRLLFKLVGTGLEKIDKEVRQAFSFPEYTTQRNVEFSQFLDNCNSVFIHARRGDMLSANGWCYKYGYFRRAVKYIKKHVDNPVFVFFTNPGSVEWCKENAKIFGLDYSKDKVHFVDWNAGDQSFRDMQLMSHCKHGIITNSTFGFWGAYFIQNPNKITISPMAEINTTYHC